MSASVSASVSAPVNVHRAVIAPVTGDGPRPLWSVMIPTFNCAAELRVALASVLAQDPGPEVMQIEVVDDCSTADDPARVVAELGAGRVGFHRQERNVGHVANFNSCLQRSRGRLVHLLHGDDFVLHGFYAAMARPFAEVPEVGAAFCRNVYVDDDCRMLSLGPALAAASGVMRDWLARIAVRQLVQPPAMVVRREVYERVGGFDSRILSYGEDWEMWVRIAAACDVWHEVEPLAAYRIRRGSLSGGAMRTGQNVRDFRTAIALNRAVLPPARAGALTRAASRAAALGALRKAHRLIRAGDLVAPVSQLREALRTSRAPEVGLRAAILLGHWSVARLARLSPLARGTDPR